MKLNMDGLQNQENMLFLVQETWQGLDPTATYDEQHGALTRARDSIEYIENAIDRGNVVLAHKESSMPSTFQMVSANSLEMLNNYIKGNEAHVRLPETSRNVLPLSDWDEGVQIMKLMYCKMLVRSERELAKEKQPLQKDLLELAKEKFQKIFSEDQLAEKFG